MLLLCSAHPLARRCRFVHLRKSVLQDGNELVCSSPILVGYSLTIPRSQTQAPATHRKTDTQPAGSGYRQPQLAVAVLILHGHLHPTSTLCRIVLKLSGSRRTISTTPCICGFSSPSPLVLCFHISSSSLSSFPSKDLSWYTPVSRVHQTDGLSI